MPKPYEIKMRVEEIALGSVLRKLHGMPGVIGVDLDLGFGGDGAGAADLAAAAAVKSGTQQDRVLRVLAAEGPLYRKVIGQKIGAASSSVNSLLHKMKVDGLIIAVGKGVYGLPVNKHATNGAQPLALPAPTIDPNGKVHHGSATATLLGLLIHARAPVARRDIRERLMKAGLTNKSVQGVLYRAKAEKLIKRIGSGQNSSIELTDKGRKHETAGAAAHG